MDGVGPFRKRVRMNDSEEPFNFEESGGNNHKLAKQIALNHPTGKAIDNCEYLKLHASCGISSYHAI